MITAYLALKHGPYPYGKRGKFQEAATIEKVFSSRQEATQFVETKNKKAQYTFWSVKAIRVPVDAMREKG